MVVSDEPVLLPHSIFNIVFKDTETETIPVDNSVDSGIIEDTAG